MSRKWWIGTLLVLAFLGLLVAGAWFQNWVQQSVNAVVAPQASVEPALIDELESLVPPLKEQEKRAEKLHLELSRIPALEVPSDDQYKRAVEVVEDSNDLVAESVDRRFAIKKEHAPLVADKASKLSAALEKTKDAEGRLMIVVGRIENEMPARLQEEIRAGNSLSSRLAIVSMQIRERRIEVEKLSTALSSPPPGDKERQELANKSLADSAVTKKLMVETTTELKAIDKEVTEILPAKPRRQRLSRRCAETDKELTQLLEALKKKDSGLAELAH